MARAACSTITACVLAVALAALPAGTGARAGDRIASDLLHSDLPIFGHGGENESPQRFFTTDTFGCGSRVDFGDWALRDTGEADNRRASWFRIRNYGAVHCFAQVWRAYERSGLDGGTPQPSFFVELDRVRVDGVEKELWVLQMGALPGSEYLLLARAPGDGLIQRFDVLQSDCPRSQVRDAGALDILLTRYCAVDSRRQLVSLARRMARHPPRGTLALAPVGPTTSSPLADGLHVFRLRSAEHPAMLRPEVIVRIDDMHITVRHPAGSPEGTASIAEGTLTWHAASRRWVIAREPADAEAEEVGGCTGGPVAVDPEAREIEVC